MTALKPACGLPPLVPRRPSEEALSYARGQYFQEEKLRPEVESHPPLSLLIPVGLQEQGRGSRTVICLLEVSTR